MQKKKHSLLEACLSTAIGFCVAYVANIVIVPLVLGIRLDHTTNVVLTSFFTLVSVVRGYAVRRFFNWLHHKGYLV